jgi:hypothetical protein
MGRTTADTLRSPPAWALVLVGALAAIAYSGFVFDLTDASGAIDLTVVSSLEAPGQPRAHLLRTLDVACGLLTLILVPYLRAALPRGVWRSVAVWSLVAFALGGIVSGIVPLPCPEGTPGCPAGAGEETQIAVHDAASIVSTAGLYLSAGAVLMALRRTGPRWILAAALSAVVFGVAYGVADLMSAGDAVGLAQRLQILGVSAWLVCVAVYCARPGGGAGWPGSRVAG